MDDKLRQRLEKVEEQLSWSGLEPKGMKDITIFTLEAIKDHLQETLPHATVEIDDLANIIILVDTFLED